MSDLETKHPTAMSTEDVEALRKADPHAFDDEPAAAKSEDELAAEEQAEAERVAAEKAEEERLAAEKAAGEKNQPVDRRQYDGVLGDLRDTRTSLAEERKAREALAAELEALKKGPAVNYDDEIKTLDAAWDKDEFDGSHADYLAKRDGLIAGKAEAGAIAKYEQQQEAKAQAEFKKEWDAELDTFLADDAHAIYNDSIPMAQALLAAVNILRAEKPRLPLAEVFKQAHDSLPFAKPAAATPENPAAVRNAADARAAAEASGQPPSIKGGAGNRSTVGSEIDFKALKPGKFSTLSPEQQAAALGGADAL